MVYKTVQEGSEVFTDAHRGYFGLSEDFIHGIVDHAQKYVDGKIHINGLENFWSLFKRCIKGTHVSVEPFHLQAYIDSELFRFNNRDLKDGGRFTAGVKGISCKRLTYKQLIGVLQSLLQRPAGETNAGLVSGTGSTEAESAGFDA